MKIKKFWNCLLLLPLFAFSNTNPILVTEAAVTLKYDETKELYYSFDAGDQIIFNMEMIKGSNIKSMEIIELPNKKVYSAFKAKDINKTIQVLKKGVYLFRFYSSSLTTRACNIKISRIPGPKGDPNFNTGWKWGTARDTSYVNYTIDSITGYNKLKYKDTVRTLLSSEIIEETVIEKTQRVHSFYNENPSSTYLKITLPPNTYTPLKEEKIIAWAYWIGVGQEAQEAYKKNAQTLGNAVEGISTMYATPLAALAVGAITDLMIPQTGEDIAYYFIHEYGDVQKFLAGETFYQFDHGKGIAAYGKNSIQTQGSFYIGLSNDNSLQGIDVEVKVVVIKQVDSFKKEVIAKVQEDPIIVKVNKTKMEIHESQIRVPAQ